MTVVINDLNLECHFIVNYLKISLKNNHSKSYFITSPTILLNGIEESC